MFLKINGSKISFLLRNSSFNLGNLVVSETTEDQKMLFRIVGNTEEVILLDVWSRPSY